MFAVARSAIGLVAPLLGLLLALAVVWTCAHAIAQINPTDVTAPTGADAGQRLGASDGGVAPSASALDSAAPESQLTLDAGVPSNPDSVDASVAPVAPSDLTAVSDADDDAGIDDEAALEGAASGAQGMPPSAAAGMPALEPGADPNTGVRGRIVDAKTGLGIEMASVLLSDAGGHTRAVITEANGNYQAFVPPGTYKVRSYYDYYHGAHLLHVRVSRGHFSEVNLRLDPIDESEDVAVEEIEVPYRADTTTAAAQDELRKASSGIGEGMGAQQMSQSGASDAGSAAKRVVGVTVEGTSLVIRGLGGRYSRVYLNGDPLPSTDPDRPSVDLDLFPTKIIDSLNVAKTFLPNMPADFAGGALEIRTITFPQRFTLDVGLSGEYSSQTTFRKRLKYDGGSYDFLGFDDGTRKLPSLIGDEPVKISRTGQYKTLQDLEKVAESFPNHWQYKRVGSAPSPGVDVALGDSFKLPGNSRLGYMASAIYDYKMRRVTGFSRKLGVDGPDEDKRNDIFSNYPDVEFGSDDVQLSGIGTASLDIGADHSFTALTLFNRSGSDETGYRAGIDGEASAGDRIEKWQLQYVGRTLWFNQLLGDHRNLLGTRLRLRWGGYYALSERDEPDRRNISYLEEGTGDTRELRWRTGSAQRFYSGLDGRDAGINLNLRTPLWSGGWGTLGGALRNSNRDFWVRRFRWVKLAGDHTDEVYGSPPEELFSVEGIGTVTRLDNEPTQNTDGFHAEQTVYSGFAMLETPLIGALSLTGGARAELYKQRMEPRSPFASNPDDEQPPKADRDDFNVLPAAALKYDLGSGMLLRAAYGMTVGRPQARELAPFIYYDFLRDRNIVGDLDLRTTIVHNADLRWEWFFAEAQVLAVSLFYKNFRRPIEQQVVSVDGSSKFSNTPEAQSYGAEFELRSNLERFGRALRFFDFGSNLTLINSVVEIPEALSGAVKAGSRRMFGQAPYVINLSLRFTDPGTHLAIGLVYNVVGPRIVDVGLRAGDAILPDVEEIPFHGLDLITSWQASEHLKLKLKWKNMLFQARRLKQGDVEILHANIGTFVSVGLDYSY